MSDFSLTLVLQIKTSKIINDMAKVQQKSEKICAFGGIFSVLDKFDSILSSVIDSHLGLRSKLIGYQYSEITRAVFSVFCCGGDCMEDLNLYLKDVLSERPHTRVPSADTVLRGYKGFDGYSPGVFTIGGLIVYLENRDGNANVRFMQAETHRRFFEMMRSFGIHVRSFRADCGSYSEDIVKTVMEHTEKFYIRAERYAGLYEKVKRQTGWTTVEIGFQQQMAKARQEFKEKTGSSTRISTPNNTQPSTTRAQVYTLSGLPATSGTRGIVIENNRKVVRK